MAQNRNLNKAKKAKNDEFYTRLTDIETELEHYWDHFRGKTVLCNCDDPSVSNFTGYFDMKFDLLDLKKVIAVSYKCNDKDMFSVHEDETAYYFEYNKDDPRDDKNRRIPQKHGPLKGDGDFRSPECVALLKEADIICTNPPFSLFREYVAQLVAHNKKFLIIGSDNAITYKDIFPLLKDNKMWLGMSRAKSFHTPCGDIKKFGNIGWYTNLTHQKRLEWLDIWRPYKPEDYPYYDDYDAIEVGKVVNIPADYDGDMGVPISFMDKYNPEQFDIIGLLPEDKKYIGGKRIYFRILIKRKQKTA